ncbi:hypothetical protein NMG60_11015855 [Bertholletia excelsa]
MGAQAYPHSYKASPKKKQSTTLQHLLDIDSENEEVLSIISYCNFTYTFMDPSESPSQQDLKRLRLIQLLSVIKTSKMPLHSQILLPLFSMLSTTLFRPLPPPCNATLIYVLPEDEDITATPVAAWPHLQIVYDILLSLIINTDALVLRDYIDHPFLLNLLSLFQSEDPRERESLKNVFHRIYIKLTFHRSFMRKAMNDVLLHYILDMDRHCGIGELLEIWGSIINGFTVPLKEQHKVFLTRVLIPLHKPKGMHAYHRQLAYCVSQFVQKDPGLGRVVVRGILKYWPITNTQKEVLIIGELEELVENIDSELYKDIALPLCTQITKCLNSWNSQVAERALYLWNNEQFVKMVSEAADDVFPVLVGAMERNLKRHWSNSVKQLTQNVKVMLEEMDSTLYNQCLLRLQYEESRAGQEEKKREEKWERIEMAAARNQFLRQPRYICVSN